MPAAVAVTFDADTVQLRALATNPAGPVHVRWLQMLADVDRTAKLKLSNQMVNVQTGNLRSSQQPPFVTVVEDRLVGVAQNIAKYALYVHDGTRPHDIQARPGGILTGWSYEGAPVFTPVVHHPGTKPRPWLREALDETMRHYA